LPFAASLTRSASALTVNARLALSASMRASLTAATPSAWRMRKSPRNSTGSAGSCVTACAIPSASAEPTAALR
jgi:hypothetical protein